MPGAVCLLRLDEQTKEVSRQMETVGVFLPRTASLISNSQHQGVQGTGDFPDLKKSWETETKVVSSLIQMNRWQKDAFFLTAAVS